MKRFPHCTILLVVLSMGGCKDSDERDYTKGIDSSMKAPQQATRISADSNLFVRVDLHDTLFDNELMLVCKLLVKNTSSDTIGVPIQSVTVPTSGYICSDERHGAVDNEDWDLNMVFSYDTVCQDPTLDIVPSGNECASMHILLPQETVTVRYYLCSRALDAFQGDRTTSVFSVSFPYYLASMVPDRLKNHRQLQHPAEVKVLVDHISHGEHVGHAIPLVKNLVRLQRFEAFRLRLADKGRICMQTHYESRVVRHGIMDHFRNYMRSEGLMQ